MFLRWIPLLMLTCLVSSCLSFSSARTGKSLKKGDTGGYMGLSFFNDVSQDEDDNDSDTTQKTYKAGFETGVQHGLGSGLEIGARGSTWGFSMIDGKYQFVDSKDFAAAAGLGLGFSTYRHTQESEAGGTISITGQSRGHIRITDVPLYLSLDLNRDLTLYGTPRYVYLHTESTGDDDDDAGGSARYASVTIGAIYGDEIGFFGELSYAVDLDDKTDYKANQFNAGLVFNRP